MKGDTLAIEVELEVRPNSAGREGCGARKGMGGGRRGKREEEGEGRAGEAREEKRRRRGDGEER